MINRNLLLMFTLSLIAQGQEVYAVSYQIMKSRGNIYYKVIEKESLPQSLNSQSEQIKAPTKLLEVDEIIRKAADKYGLDAELIHAVIKVESNYDSMAISPAGAMGVMQLMPETAKRFGVTKIFDPEQNIMAGCQYLSYLLNLFDNDLRLALAAYNAGEQKVIHYGDVPPYHETQHYVTRILKRYPNQTDTQVAFLTRRGKMMNTEKQNLPYDDLDVPGRIIEVDPEQADDLGAFEETALSEQEALESTVDLEALLKEEEKGNGEE